MHYVSLSGLGKSSIPGPLDTLMGGASDLMQHVVAADSLDFKDFLMIAGSRFDVGSSALRKTCDKVCGRMGTLLVAVGGSIRVLKAGFEGAVHGGSATYDRLTKACAEYQKAKNHLALAKAARQMREKTGRPAPAGSAEAFAKRENAVTLAQKKIIEALGGSLITASTQRKKPDAPVSTVGPPSDSYATPEAYETGETQEGGASAQGSLAKTVLLLTLAAGAAYAATR
jgi:hypothetical protein